MKITILGSGSFITDLNHFGPSYLLEHDDKKILVDAGEGCVIQLLKLGVTPTDIDYIFLTHFHADHTMDLISILVNIKLKKLKDNTNKKIKIFGQKGINDFMTGLSVFKHDVQNEYEAEELNGKTAIGDFNVVPFKVVHTDAEAIALRFEIEGKIVVFSGDTSYCPGIIDAAKDADLLIIDCSNPIGAENIIHLNPEQVAIVCAKANVKKVILSHLTSQVFDEDITAQVGIKFKGKVAKAEDFMEIKL